MPPSLMLLDLLPALGVAEVAAALLVLAVIILWIVSSAGNLEKVLAWLTAGRRQREQALNDRITALEKADEQWLEKDAILKRFEAVEAKHGTTALEVANQHNTLMENLRERERLTGEFRHGIESLREKVHGLETMPGRVDKLEGKLDNLTSQINDLKTGQRDLKTELREDMRTNKGEILQAIKDLKNS